MEITIKVTPGEVAALAVGLQERRTDGDLAERVSKEINRLSEKQDQVFR